MLRTLLIDRRFAIKPDVCYHFLVKSATDNKWAALHSGARPRLLRLRRHAPATVQRLLPRALALVVVLLLGVLSPLSCVIHCYIQDRNAERASLAFFLCGEHAVANPEDVDLLDRLNIAGSTADEPLSPRAFYELLTPPIVLLISVVLLRSVLLRQPFPALIPFVAAPPTPPPRLTIR